MNHNSISEIRTVLEQHNIALKKRFGQNFLVEPGVRHRLGDLIEQSLADRRTGSGEVWEIGPGLGALTDELLSRDLTLRLFEIDRGVIRILRERYGEDVPIVPGDFLETFRDVPAPAAVVGNLPYHSAGAIVPRIVEAGLPIPVMVFLLQSEMVDRLVGSPGTKAYGAVTVLVQNHYAVERAFSVPAGAFYPRPRVGSAVAVFRERPDRPDDELTKTLSFLTGTSFGQRRKTLRNTLKEHLPHLERCGIDASLRPEQVSPADFLVLARELNRSAG